MKVIKLKKKAGHLSNGQDEISLGELGKVLFTVEFDDSLSVWFEGPSASTAHLVVNHRLTTDFPSLKAGLDLDTDKEGVYGGTNIGIPWNWINTIEIYIDNQQVATYKR